MTAIQMSLPAVSSDATFRTWGQAWRTNLALCGLVQASDTGQIDWTTVLAPTAATQNRGYEIWKFADTLQATKPVFIKILYGSSSAGATATRLTFQVGFSTDGAGNLTSSNVSDTHFLDGNPNADTWSLMCGDTNRIAINRFSNVTSVNWQSGISIERSHDSTGADTNDGVSILRMSGWNSTGAGTPGGQHDTYIPFTGPRPVGVYTTPNALGPGGSGIYGLDVGVFPVYPFKGKYLPPRVNVLAYYGPDLTQNLPIQITHYGSAKTYMPLGIGSACGTYSAPSYRGGGGNSSWMMRWE